MNIKGLRFSWVEVLIATSVLLICARYFWAKELIEAENAFLASVGLPIYAKYFFTIPLVFLVYFDIYKDEKVKANSEGKRVVSKPVLIFSIFTLILVTLYLHFFVASPNL